MNFIFVDEMLATERGSMAGRVSDLERKVLEQGDELVCLRATLADVLRRLNLLEGLRVHHNGTSTAPSTPVRNGYSSGYGNSNTSNGGTVNNVSLAANRGNPGKELRLRQPQYRSEGPVKRATYSQGSALPQVYFDYFFCCKNINFVVCLMMKTASRRSLPINRLPAFRLSKFKFRVTDTLAES